MVIHAVSNYKNQLYKNHCSTFGKIQELSIGQFKFKNHDKERRLGFTAIWRTKQSAGVPSIYVLHIAVTTDLSEHLCLQRYEAQNDRSVDVDQKHQLWSFKQGQKA